MSERRLKRTNDGVLAGICGGIAKYFDWDPTMVRIGYILISILSAAFPGLLVYFILWFVMPKE
jgi:phage shock protein C